MTIEELLAEAARFAAYAARGADRDRIDHDRIMVDAAIAQACAQTARAMMLEDLRKSADPRY